jgi:hypothetical protein
VFSYTSEDALLIQKDRNISEKSLWNPGRAVKAIKRYELS